MRAAELHTLYAGSPVAPDGLVARIAPLERHYQGEALTRGASPDYCHLFRKKARAFEWKIVAVLSVARFRLLARATAMRSARSRRLKVTAETA
jgi:hypothetical protein